MSVHDKDLPLTHAKNANGEWKYVRDVPNGADCGCVCPICNKSLIAKHCLNEGKTPHFAHEPGVDCCASQMSFLHLRAQEIIKEKKTVMAPGYRTIAATQMHFVDVVTENSEEWKGIRPDIVGTSSGGMKWAIEIYYTNKVDGVKEEKIWNLGVSCLEIDISSQSFDGLENFLLESVGGRWWVNNPNYDQMILEKDKRLVNAVTADLLSLQKIVLPAYIGIEKRQVNIVSRQHLFCSDNGLASLIKLMGADNSENIFVICSREYFQYLDMQQLSLRFQKANILHVCTDDFEFKGYSFSWIRNNGYLKYENERDETRQIEFEKEKETRCESNPRYFEYEKYPDKYAILRYPGTGFNCSFRKDCQVCNCCKELLIHDGNSYVICDKDKRISTINEKKTSAIEKNGEYGVVIEKADYPIPFDCHNIEDFGGYLQNRGILNWKGGETKIVRLELSPDKMALFVVHHSSDQMSQCYYLTVFNQCRFNFSTATVKGDKDYIMKRLEYEITEIS